MTGQLQTNGKAGVSPQLISRLRSILDSSSDAWLVGGAIRDKLVGRSCHDLDIILPNEAKKAARTVADGLNGTFYALDEDRGMYRVLLPGERQSDVIDFSRFQGDSLDADLAMRDFTINAIALRLHDPMECVDPLNGRQDLKDRVLRACAGDSLQMDPVRVIRAVRLSVGFNLRMAEGLGQQIRQTAPLLSRISQERKRDELFKLLEEAKPSAALRLMDHLAILGEIIPETAALKGVTQSSPHILDVWEHTLAVVSGLSDLLDLFLDPDEVLKDGGNLTLGLAAGKLGRYRSHLQNHFSKGYNPFRTRKGLCLLAALLHDVAKPVTKSIGSDGRIHFFKHEVIGAQITEEIARNLALSELEVSALSSMVAYHIRPRYLSAKNLLPSRRSIYRFFRAAGETGVETSLLALGDFLALTNITPDQEEWMRELDRVAAYLEGWFEKHDSWVEPIRLVNGTDVMQMFNLPPGRLVGRVLDSIREAQASGEITSRDEALELAKQVISDMNKGGENG